MKYKKAMDFAMSNLGYVIIGLVVILIGLYVVMKTSGYEIGDLLGI